MKKPGDITVIFEDKDILAINKPAFLAVHPGFNKSDFTLVHWLNKKYPPAGSVVLLNRIDKDTSGLVLAGKNRDFVNRFNASLSKKIYKEYILLAKTTHKELKEINIPLRPVYESHGPLQPACTKVVSVQRLSGGVSLYRVTLVTGRTHQIRLHFQMVGAPLVGDWQYGDAKINQYFRREFKLHRQFLHAHIMRVPGFPEFKAPLPDDLQKILDSLH